MQRKYIIEHSNRLCDAVAHAILRAKWRRGTWWWTQTKTRRWFDEALEHIMVQIWPLYRVACGMRGELVRSIKAASEISYITNVTPSAPGDEIAVDWFPVRMPKARWDSLCDFFDEESEGTK